MYERLSLYSITVEIFTIHALDQVLHHPALCMQFNKTILGRAYMAAICLVQRTICGSISWSYTNGKYSYVGMNTMNYKVPHVAF